MEAYNKMTDKVDVTLARIDVRLGNIEHMLDKLVADHDDVIINKNNINRIFWSFGILVSMFLGWSGVVATMLFK